MSDSHSSSTIPLKRRRLSSSSWTVENTSKSASTIATPAPTPASAPASAPAPVPAPAPGPGPGPGPARTHPQHPKMSIDFLISPPPEASPEVAAPSAQPQPHQRPNRGRLNPDEPGVLPNGTRAYPGTRFCWNIGTFFRTLTEERTINADYKTFEDLAHDLFFIPYANDGVTPAEWAMIPAERLTKPEYRSIRARILVGLALIHEHNQRGERLNRTADTHPAVRPELRRRYKAVNLGKTQAQEVCFGTDVSRASSVYLACQAAGYVPSETVLKDIKAGTMLDEADRCWPKGARKRLYKLLSTWYEGQDLGPELKFVVDEQTKEAEVEEDDKKMETVLESVEKNEVEQTVVEEHVGKTEVRQMVVREQEQSRWNVVPPPPVRQNQDGESSTTHYCGGSKRSR